MEESTEERWVTAAGFPDYEVSDHGRIRRVTPGRNTYPGRVLALRPQTNGYTQVILSGRGVLVHRIVYQSFVGPIPPGAVINHKDMTKSNNSLTNLEAVSRAYNLRHAAENSDCNVGPGERHWNNKLSSKDIEDIRAMDDGTSEIIRTVARKYNISESHARLVLDRQSRVKIPRESDESMFTPKGTRQKWGLTAEVFDYQGIEVELWASRGGFSAVAYVYSTNPEPDVIRKSKKRDWALRGIRMKLDAILTAA